MIIGNYVSLVLLGCMSWQDFKARMISVWLLPAIGIAVLFGEWNVLSANAMLTNGLFNAVLLAIQLLLLKFFVHVRYGKKETLLDKQIGWGDIILLLSITPVFHPLNFCLFITGSAICALLFHIGVRMFRSSALQEIPLAGVQGVLLLVYELLLVCKVIVPQLSSASWLTDLYSSTQHP